MKLWIQSESFQKGLKELTNGAAIKNVPAVKILKNIPFPLPSVTEQKRIIDILEKTFIAIDLAKINAQNNLKNSKDLYQSYLKKVFSNHDNKSNLKRWGDICSFVRGPFGGSLKKSMFKKKGYVVYEQKHAIHNHFNQLRYFIDQKKFNEMKRFEVQPGDIIMSCSGTIGCVAIIPPNIPKGIINQALLKLTPSKEVFPSFLVHWLRSVIFQDIITQCSAGAAIKNVPAGKVMKEILIPLPKISEQKKLVKEIDNILSKTKSLENIYLQKCEELDELKKSILQKAFNGEL